MKKIILNLIFIFSLSILFTPFVFAENVKAVNPSGQPNNADKEEMMQDKKDGIQAKKDEKGLQKCENTANRIATKIARFQENKASHVEKYNALTTKLEEIITALADKGIDTADLEEHLAVLESMIADYAVSYDDFLAELSAVENTACGEENGFKDDMKAIRGMFKSLLDERLAIRKYYVEVIRLDVKGIREQTREKAKEKMMEKAGDQEEVVEESSESEEE